NSFRCCVWPVKYFGNFADWQDSPSATPLPEHRLKVPFKKGAGVLEVLFDVGLGSGDALKRLVEDTDDPLLFRERRNGDRIVFNELLRNTLVPDSARHPSRAFDSKSFARQVVVEPFFAEPLIRAKHDVFARPEA